MQENNNSEIKVTRPTRLSWKLKIIILLVVVAVGYGGWRYYEQKKVTQVPLSSGQTQTPLSEEEQAKLEKETQSLIASVGKLIMLPDETPTFATILDAKKLIAEEPFYTGSVNGDQLLVFSKSQKAIIYSPTKNILVNVGPIYFNNASSTPATSGD